MTFKEYLLEKQRHRQSHKKSKDLQKSQKLGMARGMNIDRKSTRQVPVSHTINPLTNVTLPQFITGLDITHDIINTAKAASSGIWKVSNIQAKQIADKYGFKLPTTRKPHKHLGSMSIQLVKFRNSFFLYKPIKRKKRHKKHFKALSNIGKIF